MPGRRNGQKTRATPIATLEFTANASVEARRRMRPFAGGEGHASLIAMSARTSSRAGKAAVAIQGNMRNPGLLRFARNDGDSNSAEIALGPRNRGLRPVNAHRPFGGWQRDVLDQPKTRPGQPRKYDFQIAFLEMAGNRRILGLANDNHGLCLRRLNWLWMQAQVEAGAPRENPKHVIAGISRQGNRLKRSQQQRGQRIENAFQAGVDGGFRSTRALEVDVDRALLAARQNQPEAFRCELYARPKARRRPLNPCAVQNRADIR